jgi:hypothetical protein
LFGVIWIGNSLALLHFFVTLEGEWLHHGDSFLVVLSLASDFDELYSEFADQWSKLHAEMGRCDWVNISRALDSSH